MRRQADHILHLRGSPPIEALNGKPVPLENRILALAGQLSDPALSRMSEVEWLRLSVALRQLEKALSRWREKVFDNVEKVKA